jgi:hypothetical protein
MTLAVGALIALGFLALTGWRPVIGCAVFAFAIPLTTGLGRGTIVPFLRPNEALLLALLAGLLVYSLRRRPEPHSITALDLAVWTFAIGLSVIPLLVLFVGGSSGITNPDTLRTVFQPVQFLLVYLVFSRTHFFGPGLRILLNMTMLASIPVALLAAAELAVPGVRVVAASVYPTQPSPVGWDPLYRPESTLGHYSAVAAFAVFNYALALALATARHPDFPKPWLTIVMTVNLASLVASLTWAPQLALPLVTGLILWQGGRIPRELWVTAAALAVAFVLFWPSVSARTQQQGVSSSVGSAITLPQTFVFRVHHWEEFFLPALQDHIWLGTGTVLPSMVPERLESFVDNEYLREGFRAGIVGLTLFVAMFATIAVAGRQCRASSDPTRRSIGSTCLALVAFLALIGLTGEYLFFSGVSQEFAMLIGLLAASRPAAAPAFPERAPALALAPA